MIHRNWDALDQEAEDQGNAIRAHRRLAPKPTAIGKRTAQARMNDRRCVAHSESNCNRLGGRAA